MAKSVFFYLSLLLAVVHATYDPTLYLCSVCMTSVEQMATVSNTITSGSLLDGCKASLPADSCKLFFGDNDYYIKDLKERVKNPRQLCADEGFCPKGQETWQTYQTSGDLDVRVSKALGSRGYDKVRVSVISNSTISSPIFDYSAQFKYKWTDKYLSTGIVTVTPGVKNTITITPGNTIDITIPTEGSGTRGVIIADPCFQSQWIKCLYQDTFSMFNHTVELINAINSHDDVSFWQILGDNFYDQTGEATGSFFDALSQQAKSKVFQTVPGNHDYWVHGAPYLHVSKDQVANGFMQFYGQDVMASSANPSIPYDFSQNPDKSTIFKAVVPTASNFFFYNKVGNIGFMGYSGANSYDEQLNYFNEACTWASSANLDLFLILGHWNSDGMGCDSDVTVPALYSELIALPACQSVVPKMKYFMGHAHCNKVTSPDLGFMVGAMGMSDKSCTGQFGIPVVDTTGGMFKVYYFPVNEVDSYDNYDTILSCIKAKGVSGCYDLATLWSSVPL